MVTIPETMKAAVLMESNHLEVKEVPTPKPGPQDVVIRVQACAVCGSDVSLMDKPWPGQPPYGSFIPGHEYAGTVEGVGETVDEFQVGDRVAVEVHLGCMRCRNCRLGNYTACLNYGTEKHRANGFTANGGFAEYVINHINTVHPIPDHIDFDEASLITNLGCVLYGFQTVGGFVAGDRVVVIGPGPLGLICVQVAKTLGADKVYLLGTRASRLRIGKETGADLVINVRNENPVRVIHQETRGLGADLVIESSGAKEGVMMAIKMTRPMGKILMLGVPHEPVLVDFEDLLLKNKSIHTVRGEGWANCARAVSLLASEKVTLKPLVTHSFPLDDISTAFRTFTQRLEGAVKVIVKPNE